MGEGKVKDGKRVWEAECGKKWCIMTWEGVLGLCVLPVVDSDLEMRRQKLVKMRKTVNGDMWEDASVGGE